jgi:hypothetical protein
MLLQEKIKHERVIGGRDVKQPTGDFSRYLPDGDPVRAELESLFVPFTETGAGDSATSRIIATS